LTFWRFIKACLIGTTLGLIVGACSTDFIRIDKKHKTRNASLEQIREMLYDITNKKLGDPSISLGFMKKEDYEKFYPDIVVGTCNYALASQVPEIDIRKDYWQWYNTRQKLILLAHEYFHCQCPFFGHIEGDMKDGCPKDFMNPMLPGRVCIRKHWQHYEKQIKEGCNGLRRNKPRNRRVKATDVLLRR
jgi:hypothetical protein